MITPAIYEDVMRENADNKDLNKAVIDTVSVLKQHGFDAGAFYLEQMLTKSNGKETER